MVKATCDQIMSGAGSRGLMKIANAPMDPYSAHKIGKIVTEIQKTQDSLRHKFNEEVKKPHALRDDKNNIVQDFSIARGFKVKDEEIFKKAQEDFGKSEVSISADKIKFATIAQIKLTPAEMDGLDWILEEPNYQQAPTDGDNVVPMYQPTDSLESN